MAGLSMAHKRDAAVISEVKALRIERQTAKANIDELRTFLDLWSTATDNKKLSFVKDLSQILRTTIKAAVL